MGGELRPLARASPRRAAHARARGSPVRLFVALIIAVIAVLCAVMIHLLLTSGSYFEQTGFGAVHHVHIGSGDQVGALIQRNIIAERVLGLPKSY